MSDTNFNSAGTFQRRLEDFGTWEMTAPFNVPDGVQVTSPANVLPFSTRTQGLLDGFAAGVFTVPKTGMYAISWAAHGVGGDNGVGLTRSSQIVINNDVNNSGQMIDSAIQLGKIVNFGVSTILTLSIGDTVICGIVQDSGATYPIDDVTTFLRIIKLSEV